MKKNIKTKTHNLYKIIFILVVFLGIGYAFLEAGLNINGDVTITAPELNVYVQNTSVTSGSTTGTPTIIGNDKKEVDFSTALTNDVNSFFEETTTLVNKGSTRPHLLGVDVKVYDSSDNEVTLSAPYEYTVTKGDGTPLQIGETIGVGNTESFKFKFNYVSGTDMNTVTDYPTYTFKITYNYVVNSIIYPSGKNKDNLEFGDEVCILDQCFNFIKYDGTNNEDIVLLSKWNLKVGDIYETTNWTKTGSYTSNDSGYGKQSSEARGAVSGASTYNGIVQFSYTNYWDDNGSPKSDYTGSYSDPNYPVVYDTQNKTEPDFTNQGYDTVGYSIAYYVDLYESILTGYGVTIKDARLLTYSEVIDANIGCTQQPWSCLQTGFVENTTFWLGSARDDSDIWRYSTRGSLDFHNSYRDTSAGVRPVIVLSKSNI